MALFSELRRRNVFKVALLYALASLLVFWVLGGSLLWLGAPAWANEFVLLVLAIGYPVALIFSWAYEITPSGIRKSLDVDQTQSIVYKTGQKLNAAMAVLAVLGVLALVGEQLLPTFEFPKIIEPIVPEPVYEVPDHENVPQEIRAHTLDNGLRVIVWPDHDMPDVVMYNFVRAGSRNELSGITGLSHLFEHLMFSGTERFPPGEFDRAMEAVGGTNNAYTSEDLTVFQNWFPSTALEAIFDLEGDRLANLALNESVVESVRSVVSTERLHRFDNDNFGRLRLAMNAAAFTAHPYQLPVMGWTSDIKNWSLKDIDSYFRTYYAPNNLTIVIAGDVTPKEVFILADKHFGSLRAQEPPPAVRTVEPEQLGERRLTIERDAPTILLHLAFHAGSAADSGSLAMGVLLYVLVGDSSSRLQRRLVDDEPLALAVGGLQISGFDPGLAYFHMTLPAGADTAVAETRLLEELDRVAREGITDVELERARDIMVANYRRSLETIDGRTSAMGHAEVFLGDYELAFSVPDDLAALTAADIQLAAADVFDRRNMTLGILRPPADRRAQ